MIKNRWKLFEICWKIKKSLGKQRIEWVLWMYANGMIQWLNGWLANWLWYTELLWIHFCRCYRCLLSFFFLHLFTRYKYCHCCASKNFPFQCCTVCVSHVCFDSLMIFISFRVFSSYKMSIVSFTFSLCVFFYEF